MAQTGEKVHSRYWYSISFNLYDMIYIQVTFAQHFCTSLALSMIGDLSYDVP